jgi:hypothetical protein
MCYTFIAGNIGVAGSIAFILLSLRRSVLPPYFYCTFSRALHALKKPPFSESGI